jgi:RNA polymerase sigma-70 factor, ECF subfamily
VAIALGWAVLGERPRLLGVGGGGLCLTGIAIARRPTKRSRRLVHRSYVVLRRRATEAAIEDVYRARYPSFLRFGFALLGNREQARDAVQETFAEALRKSGSFRGEGSLDGWLWRTMLNTCRQEQRRRARIANEEPPERATNGLPPEWPELRAAVAALPARERHVVFLRYYAGLAQDDIAAVLGVRPGTVAATLSHARAKLRRAVAGEVAS